MISMKLLRPLSPETAATLYVGSVVLLTAIGLVMVYSATAFEAPRSGMSLGLFEKQILWTLIAGGVLLLFTRVDYRWLGAMSGWLLLILIVMLVFVLIPQLGVEVKGARRWFRLGPLSFQPSELAKLVMVIFTARYLSMARGRLEDFKRGTLPLLVVIGVVCFLVALEPDLGTSLFLAGSILSLSVIGGIRVRHMVPMVAVALPLFLVFMLTRFDHIQARFSGFRDPMGSYQLRQSLLALGSGGWTGVGLGAGREKLYFLPERTSDFIFSLLGEEMGFVGTTAVIFLFLLLVTLGLRIALSARDSLGFYMAIGITLLVGLQAATNIAVITASVPTKGISLPFISAGGSLLLTLYAGAGILVSIARASDPSGGVLLEEGATLEEGELDDDEEWEDEEEEWEEEEYEVEEEYEEED